MTYLLIGATSTMGGAAAAALRESDPRAFIIGTTSKSDPVPHCDQTISGIDLTRKGAAYEIFASVGRPVDAVIFTPAYGPLGFPVAEATGEQVREALAFSYWPLVELLKLFRPSIAVAFSSFHWLPRTSSAYGSMGKAKAALEALTLQYPGIVRIVRAGSFVSKSTRAIGLMIRRTLKKTSNALILALAEEWKRSGVEFHEYFFRAVQEEEKAAFENKFSDKPYRPTTVADLRAAVIRAIGGSAPIVNVIGGWMWEEMAPSGHPNSA